MSAIEFSTDRIEFVHWGAAGSWDFNLTEMRTIEEKGGRNGWPASKSGVGSRPSVTSLSRKPMDQKWLWIRLSSPRRTRMYSARSGTSTPMPATCAGFAPA